jgi:DNA-binding XRE family transcriptional regulator
MARLRRHLPSELVAERAYISRQTLTAIEKGSPSVAIGAYAAVLHALKIDEQISAAETSRQMVVYC